MDPDRKKMSKSKGNVITPLGLLESYGSDGVRYWAASGRPGADTIFDEGQMKIGRRLAIKILNASRFVLGFGEDVAPDAIDIAVDRSMLAQLETVVERATQAFEAFDYARALDVTESSFWTWTDDYLELVKGRAYGEDDAARSAHAALQLSLSVYLRLFAPFLPFVTEEVWSWWRKGSVHRSNWPVSEEFENRSGNPAVLEVASQVLAAVRRAKSDAKTSMRTELVGLAVTASLDQIEAVKQAEPDLLEAARSNDIEYLAGDFAVKADLAD
jgi:valyl-tRNA synthetase